MPKPVLALALALVLAAAVYAQTQLPKITVTVTDIFNTQKAEEAVAGAVSYTRFGLQLGFFGSLGVMIFIIFKNIVLEQSGIPGVFRDKWFWVPFSIFAVLLGFWLVAQFSAPVQVMYRGLVGDNCPLYWCP
jgi:glucan phosphoethanolaminetransferase (alkaline phosphatase superfamily)